MIASENEFEGKVALITGATSGIGRAVAIEFSGCKCCRYGSARRTGRCT